MSPSTAAPRDHGALGVGLYLAAIPIGTVLGDVLAAQLLTHAGRMRLVRPTVLASSCRVCSSRSRRACRVALGLLVVTGSARCGPWGWAQLRVDLAPPEMLGRVITLSTSMQMVTQGSGSPPGRVGRRAAGGGRRSSSARIVGLLVTAVLESADPR